MITLVALLEVSNIALKLSDLQYDALVAQIPSQQSSQHANLFSRRIVGTHIDVYYSTVEESMKVGLISLIWSFLHLLILRFCCYQCYLELISRIIAQARETESFIVHFNRRRRKSDCFSSCSKLVLLILQSLHALRFRLIKYGALESSLDDKKSSKSDIKHDSYIKDDTDIKNDSDI